MKTKMTGCKSPKSYRGKLRLTLLLATCIAVVSASAQTLLFNFPFNEGTGTNIASTVNSLPGSLGLEGVSNSAPTFSTDTPSGQPGDYSISFAYVAGDYQGNRIHVEDPGMAIDVTDPITGTNRSFTFQCWVKFGVQPGARATIFDNNGPGMKANIAILGDRSIAMTTYGIVDMTSHAKIVDDGLWHHIAVVHEHAVEVRFYIDGILSDTVAYTDGVNVSGPQAYFHMGMEVWDWPDYGSGVSPFVGKIDRMSLSRESCHPIIWTGGQSLALRLLPQVSIRPNRPLKSHGRRRLLDTSFNPPPMLPIPTVGWMCSTPHPHRVLEPITIYGPTTSPQRFYRLFKP